MYCFYALRKSALLVIALSIIAVASRDAQAADKKAATVEDWQIRGEKGTVTEGKAYALLNLTCSKYLSQSTEGKARDCALAWDNKHKPRTEPTPEIVFWRDPRSAEKGPLKFGETVMISSGPRGGQFTLYIIYKEQDKGINLRWLGGGNYQWEIQGGPKGSPIPTNAKISLYNQMTKDYVIYAEREHGINLRWNTDVNPPRDHRKKK